MQQLTVEIIRASNSTLVLTTTTPLDNSQSYTNGTNMQFAGRYLLNPAGIAPIETEGEWEDYEY
jgi:hypothetical protein